MMLRALAIFCQESTGFAWLREHSLALTSFMEGKFEKTTHLPRRSRRVRWLLVSGLVLVALVGLARLVFRDASPPDESQIQPLPPKPTVMGGNPLEHFCVEIQKHPVSGYQPLLRRAQVKGGSENVPENEVRDFLDKNAVQMRLFDALMETDPATWNWPEVHSSSIFKVIPYVDECDSVGSELQQVRIDWLIRQEKWQDALNEIFKTMHYGLGLCGARGLPKHWVAGLGCSSEAEWQLSRVLPKAHADEATLKIAGSAGVTRDPVGHKVTLQKGTYKITMVGQARDDNTLRLTVR